MPFLNALVHSKSKQPGSEFELGLLILFSTLIKFSTSLTIKLYAPKKSAVYKEFQYIKKTYVSSFDKDLSFFGDHINESFTKLSLVLHCLKFRASSEK